MNANLTPYALGSEHGEMLWFFGMLVTMKATAEQTGGEFSSRRYSHAASRPSTDDESFYILEGGMTFYLEDGQPIPASAGSFVHIPEGYVPHAFQVGSETAQFLVLTRPPHEHFIRAAEPAPSRTLPPQELPDMEKVGAAAVEYGIEILGPPPGTQPRS